MAAVSSNEARTTCLFNTFRSSCQFVAMLIDDLISCDEDIPDYIFTASNELLTKVLCLTNSIYKISGTLKEDTKKKLGDPSNQCDGKRVGPMEFNSSDEQSRTASQVSRESNNTNSNTETSPFISFVKAATQKMNTYSIPESKKPSSGFQNDTHPKKHVPLYSPVQEKVPYKSAPAANTSARGAAQNDALPKKKIVDGPLKKGFSVTHNYKLFIKTLINPSGDPSYYCQLCDCLVTTRNWPTHIEVAQHKSFLSKYSKSVLVECSHCQFIVFAEADTVSKYFSFHQQKVHPDKGAQVLVGVTKAVSSAKTSEAAAQNSALNKGPKVDTSLRKGYSITNQFYIFIKRLQLQLNEPIYFCQLCDCMVLTKKWFTHIEVAQHKKLLKDYPTGVLVKCSHCQLNLFTERDTVSKYFSFHSEMVHKGEKNVKVIDNPAETAPSAQPANQKPVLNAKKSKKQNAEAVSSVKNGPSGQRGAADVDRDYSGECSESPFCYILRVAREHFEIHQMKANVYFCIPCQSVCDSKILWREHIQMLEHFRMLEHTVYSSSHSCTQTVCPSCGLTLLGPKESFSEYLKFPLHLELDSLFS